MHSAIQGGERGPVASMGSGWPDNHWSQRPTVCTYALDGGNHRALDARASIVSRIVLTYKDLDRAKHAQHDSSLVHVINVLGEDGRSCNTSLITSNQCIILS